MLNHEVNQMNYKLLHEKEEVVRRVMVRYKARVIPKADIMDLVNDDQLSYDHIFCCLTIDDPRMIDKIFTEKEKKDHRWERDDNARRGMVYKHKDEAHRRYNQLILDEMEGRRLDIIFESKDGKFVTGFLTRDMSTQVVSYIYAHTGAAKFTGLIPRSLWSPDVTDEEFKLSYRWYLEALEEWNKL